MDLHEYFIGFDIGTDSIGWAVTAPDYQLVKKSGKSLWGVRLFDSAQTAQDRRVHRIARRRIERRRQRLEWLQKIFALEIGRADPATKITTETSPPFIISEKH